MDPFLCACARADDGDSEHGDASRCSVPCLPEDIWHHIHSLMPIRAAARAACISTAFLHSWRRRPNLALNWKTLEAGECSCGLSSVPYEKKVDSILRNHSGIGLKILEVDFEFDYGCRNFSYADRWVRIAVVPGIEELALTLYKDYNFPCTRCIEGELPATAELTILEPCTRCHSSGAPLHWTQLHKQLSRSV